MKALLKCAATLLFVGVAAIFNGCSTSEPQSAAKHANEHHAGPSTHQSEVNVPDKAGEVFRETERHFEQLAAAIRNKDARMAHRHDSAIRTLIGSIPHRSTDDTKADTLARQITDAARAAHRSAHEDQWAEAADHVRHGQASLATLRMSFKELSQ